MEGNCFFNQIRSLLSPLTAFYRKFVQLKTRYFIAENRSIIKLFVSSHWILLKPLNNSSIILEALSTIHDVITLNCIKKNPGFSYNDVLKMKVTLWKLRFLVTNLILNAFYINAGRDEIENFDALNWALQFEICNLVCFFCLALVVVVVIAVIVYSLWLCSLKC